jgi:hypothetical protein
MMSSTYAPFSPLVSDRARAAGQRFVAELSALLYALTHPNKVVAEVEAMRALQLEADRIEATQPVRAEMLRRQAAHTGL